jgi:hypothetical protein
MAGFSPLLRRMTEMQVYYRLVYVPAGGILQTYQEVSFDKVRVAEEADVIDFRDAVFVKNKRLLPSGVCAAQLKVYLGKVEHAADKALNATDAVPKDTKSCPLLVLLPLHAIGILQLTQVVPARNVGFTGETTTDESPKRKKLDCLDAGENKVFIFRTTGWCCVTVMRKRFAVTFAHGPHSSFKSVKEIMEIRASLTNEGKLTSAGIDDAVSKYRTSLEIYTLSDMHGTRPIPVTVLQSNTKADWLLLESQTDLCTEEPQLGFVVEGRGYYQLGLSAMSQLTSPISFTKGVISSTNPNDAGHVLGSAGANPGDSGGGCFEESTGCLLGINIGAETTQLNFTHSAQQIMDNLSSRYSVRAHIVPITNFQYLLPEFTSK